MISPELFTGIVRHPSKISGLPFGEERIRKEGNVVYIYDASGRRRWVIHRFVMDWEKKRYGRLELQGETRGGTWHTLIGVYQACLVETNEEIDTGIVVGAINGPTNEWRNPTTPSIEIIYSKREGGKLKEGVQGGYRGRAETIAADLEELHALVQTPEKLPKRIDVDKTAQLLVESFCKGRFEPPSFVLPNAKVRAATGSAELTAEAPRVEPRMIESQIDIISS